MMKKIDLPIVNTARFKIDIDALNNANNISSNSLTSTIPLGNIGEKNWQDLQITRENGNQIICCTVNIEKDIEEIMLSFFMGSVPELNEKRELFKSELLQTSFLTFSAKKHIVMKIAEKTSSYKERDRNKLQSYLKSIMSWRNAFAHGELIVDATTGIHLEYYSGGKKSDVLDVGYWNTIESIFKNCDKTLKSLKISLTK